MKPTLFVLRHVATSQWLSRGYEIHTDDLAEAWLFVTREDADETALFRLRYRDEEYVVVPVTLTVEEPPMPTSPDPDRFTTVNGIDLTFRADTWAKAFMSVVNDGAEVDEGLMLGWFANALACGYDEGVRAQRRFAEDFAYQGHPGNRLTAPLAPYTIAP